jgi:hypothetical protein
MAPAIVNNACVLSGQAYIRIAAGGERNEEREA